MDVNTSVGMVDYRESSSLCNCLSPHEGFSLPCCYPSRELASPFMLILSALPDPDWDRYLRNEYLICTLSRLLVIIHFSLMICMPGFHLFNAS